MLDKAERWDTYLRVWDAILARTDLYLNLRGDAADGNPALAACIRRPAGAATPPRPFAPRPERIEVHFLHRQIGRRAAIARRLAQGDDGKAAPGRLLAPPRRSAPPVLSTTEIEGRLFRAAADAGEG
jgi:hypothetical protein